MMPIDARASVAIIGGGVTGACVAYHFFRSGPSRDMRVLVYEPRDRLGPGLAYDTSDDVLRANVPATRMSLLPDDEGHFTRWLTETRALERDTDAHCKDGETYPRRAIVGAYVAAHIGPLLSSGQIEHVRERVTSVCRVDNRWRVTTHPGAHAEVDFLVIATTHPKPRLPAALASISADPRLLADGLESRALRSIAADERVLIIGAGLTSADVIAVLDSSCHRGPITMISRRGLRARPQPTRRPCPYGDFSTNPARTARTLLGEVRQTIASAKEQGVSWHAVIEALRIQGDYVWNALPLIEQRRLLRHLRPFWDVHRFRAAPQIDAILARKFAAGEIEFFAATLRSVAADGDALLARLYDRRRQRMVERHFDRIVVTTGPSHADILAQQPYLAGLADRGFIAVDPTELGLHTSRDGRAIGHNGRSEPNLFIAGPLARGTFGELMGLPQVTSYAAFIARQLREAATQLLFERQAATGSGNNRKSIAS